MIYHILLLTGILLTVIGQLLLKKGMNTYPDFGIKDSIKLIKDFPIIIGMVFYGISLMLWLVTISKLELSYAYPIVSLNYFFIALFSKWAFKEHISKRRWLSIFTIIMGVILISMS